MAKQTFPRADALREMRERTYEQWERDQAAGRLAAKGAGKPLGAKPPEASSAGAPKPKRRKRA